MPFERRTVLVTAIFYFAIVFAVAFVTGVVRVLVVSPRIGPVAAVLLEVPILLAASWAVARRLLRYRHLRACLRFAVGALAFAMLMATELLLARAMFGQTLSQWANAVATTAGLIGLAGQFGFAAMPLLAGQVKSPPSR